MYQIKAQNGYDVQVIGNLARIYDRTGNLVFEGGYKAAVKWLEDRGIGPADGTRFPR